MSSPLKEPVWKFTRREVYYVDEDVPVSTASKVMLASNVTSILITRDQKVIGIVTFKDIIRKIVAVNLDSRKTTVAEIMSTPLITINKNEPTEKAFELMEKYDTRRVVVLDDDGKTFGMLVELAICGDLLDRQTKTRLSGAENLSWFEEMALQRNKREIETET
jgi:predicted transcriptional regulator